MSLEFINVSCLSYYTHFTFEGMLFTMCNISCNIKILCILLGKILKINSDYLPILQ